MKKLYTAALLLFMFLFTSLPVTIASELTTPAQTQGEYRLSKYDVLNIVIVGFSDGYFDKINPQSEQAIGMYSTTTSNTSNYFSDILIGPDGYVNLPYAGAVKLAGLTIPEATALLTEKLSEYIKIPSMSVIVKQYGPRKVYVMGEVQKPGMYALSSDYMNVFAAISSAGGIAKRGRTKEIAVVRVIGGKVNVQKLDINRFIKNQDITQNIALQDGDMIYVPRSNKIDLNEDIMPVLSMFGLYKSLTN